MIEHEPQGGGYYAASHWFQGGVVLIVLVGLIFALLSALDEAKARSEQLIVELTVRNMRTGMQLALGEAMMQQRAPGREFRAGQNPLAWLGSEPAGYVGGCPLSGRQDLPPASWCFDERQEVLVYRPRAVQHLRAAAGDQPNACAELAWRVERSGDSARGTVGWRIEEVTGCRWSLEGA